MTQNTPQTIAIEKLADHPQNPRIALREDVVSAIAANLDGGFDAAHSLIVRPVADGYQVLSGHHRKAAALKAGLTEVPCWVRELDDDAAYMALVTSNSQGELSPLEIGLHALHCVGLSEGGRGKKGGLSGYAALIGKAAPHVTVYRQAATVFESVKPLLQCNGLHEKTQHLSAIHSLPVECWPAAVQIMLDKAWSAKETGEQVKAANVGYSPKATTALLAGKTSTRELERIAETRDRVAANFAYPETVSLWAEWFDATDPIDIKEVQAKRIELEEQEYARREAEKPQEEEPTAPVLPNLVLADPPWRYDFAETDNRQIENQYPSATIDEIIAHRPETQPDCVLLLWGTVAKLREAFEVLDGWGFEYKTHAVWDKEKIGMGYWFRGQHELLIVATKGKMSPPEQADRVSSVFREVRGKHSAKPECVYQWIEQAFKAHTKLEMYCRAPRAGWLVFGNEAA